MITHVNTYQPMLEGASVLILQSHSFGFNIHQKPVKPLDKSVHIYIYLYVNVPESTLSSLVDRATFFGGWDVFQYFSIAFACICIIFSLRVAWRILSGSIWSQCLHSPIYHNRPHLAALSRPHLYRRTQSPHPNLLKAGASYLTPTHSFRGFPDICLGSFGFHVIP